MSPDSEHLGERIAKLEQRVEDIDKRVGDVGAVAVAVGVLTERVETIGRDLKSIGLQLTTEVDTREQREKDNKRERRDIKIALWTFSVMIVCALIGAAALILTTAH